jgi:hypothetical protein
LFAAPARSEEAKPADPAAKKVTYVDDIQPIFREHCYTCHNQDEAKSDLQLQSYGATMRGGAGGEVVFPGDLESSRLWALVSHAETPKMPPEQDKLPEPKLNLIKQWILDGALESAGSKARVVKKPNLDLNSSAGIQKPSGPPPMPEGLFRQPFVVTKRGAAITAMASSPWAPLVAVAGQKQILLYNTDTAELLGVLPFPEGTPQVLKFSRNGALLLCGGGRGGQSGRVVLYNVKSGERVAEIGEEVDAVLAADISPDHKLVALGSPRRVVRVYNVEDGSLEYELRKHTDWVYAIEFSPNGKYLATSDRSGGLLLWEAETGREYQNLVGHTQGVTDVSWRIDSKVLLSGGEEGSLKLWEPDTGKLVKTWSADGSGVQSAKFGRNGNIVSSGRTAIVKLWDGTGKELQTFKGMTEQVLECVFTHDDARIVAGDWSGDIRMWDSKDGTLVSQMIQNVPTLDVLIATQTAQLASAEEEARRLPVEVEQYRKAAEAAATAYTLKNGEVAAAEASSNKLPGELAAADKALKAAEELHKPLRDKVLKYKAERDKLRDGGKAEDKKAADEKLAEARKAEEKADAAVKTAAEKRNRTKEALKRAQNSLPAMKKDLEKLAAAKAAADKARDEKVSALKSSEQKLASMRKKIDQTRTEKAAYDKAHSQQASASK